MAGQRDTGFVASTAALTPVIGTLLIIAITIMGMTVIMVWGAPTIEALRLGNAQDTIVGEFEQIRIDAHVLSVEDSSRLPLVNIPGGELSLEQGSRIMVSYVYHNATDAPLLAGCTDLVVTGWNSAPTTDLDLTGTTCGTIEDTLAACGTNECVRIYEVRGGSLIEKGVLYDPGTGIAQNLTEDFTDPAKDWLIRITNDTATNSEVYAEAWIFSADRLAWTQAGGVGTYSAFYDMGAVFSSREGSIFQEKRPFVQERHFGESVFFFRLDTLDAFDDYRSIATSDSVQVFLALQSMHARADVPNVPELRFVFQGDLAEAWCGSLLVRNSFITGGAYAEDADLGLGASSCTDGNSEGLRGVIYSESGVGFPFQFIHANVRAVLQI